MKISSSFSNEGFAGIGEVSSGISNTLIEI